MRTLWIMIFLWSLPWKGVALWKAARNHQKGWYIALCILQTLGILEILYIFKFQKNRNLKADPLEKTSLFSDQREYKSIE